MKLVVPLTIPSTRCTFVTTSDSRSTLITGIAAHTLASKRSCTPAAEAVENVAAGRLDAAHHLGDDRDRRVADDVGEARRQHAVRRPERALLAEVADERLDDPEPVPGRPLDVVRLLVEQAVDRGADRAVAEQRDRDVNGRHAPPRPAPRGPGAGRPRAAAARPARSASPPARAGPRGGSACPGPSPRSTPSRTTRPGSAR